MTLAESEEKRARELGLDLELISDQALVRRFEEARSRGQKLSCIRGADRARLAELGYYVKRRKRFVLLKDKAEAPP